VIDRPGSALAVKAIVLVLAAISTGAALRHATARTFHIRDEAGDR
jgi:hypothetical protein